MEYNVVKIATLLQVLPDMWNLKSWSLGKCAMLSTHFQYVGSLLEA